MLGKRAVTLAADFNNEGNIDLYTSGCQDNSVDIDNTLRCSTGIFYESLGNGQFKAHQDNGLKPIKGEITASVADVNDDGLLDIFTGESLPFNHNIPLIGILTNSLYINKVN